MGFHFEAEGGCGILSFDGPLTIVQAADIKQAFLEAIAGVDALTVGVDPGSEMDLTFLQMLCAAHRTMIARGKRLILSETALNAVRRVGAPVGFTSTRCCGVTANTGCLLGGGRDD